MAVGTARGGFFALAALAIAIVAGIAVLVPAGAAPLTERAWAEDREWEVSFGRDAKVQGRWQPFYLIAPIDAANPQSRGNLGLGPHDNVMHGKSRAPGSSGPCKVLLVVPGPNGVPGVNIEVVPDPDLGIPFVRAVDVDGDEVWEPLTSVAAVEGANAAGLVSLFEPQPGGEPITFRCHAHTLR